ncbi:nosX protein [Roseobacter sp. SK209-2-6]|uniref:FAD:protein FMN transferase n=1 Tax=Roseobacter sp. SK209-2-6 TaxID=388739 RepID=UPI0000F3ECD5|nr:FAD:protein FMN transferase [Roseobacter sp. SK209-2-6]EBA16855.1 nosX protein [Roseobacter sp. SK209-2-6]
MSPSQSRRRFLCLSASLMVAGPALAANSPVAHWQGHALGATAQMTLAGLDPQEAAPVFARVEKELSRLEAIFSIYRPDSEVARLNATGRIALPSPELLDILSLSASLHRASKGAFDPTVQPLWQARALGKSEAGLNRGFQHLRYDPSAVSFARPDMGLTLNGIAQGYITDRIAALLRSESLTDILVDMGEISASGLSPDGNGWRAGITSPAGDILQRVTLQDRALATSAGSGTQLSDGSSHILDPRSGEAAHLKRLVSVSAPSAALADGFSTALCLLSQEDASELIRHFPGTRLEHFA